MAIVEITNIHLSSHDVPGIVAAGIDSPIVGSRFRAQSVEFNGWVVSGPRRVKEVEVQIGEQSIRRFPVVEPREDVARQYPGVRGVLHSGFVGSIDLEAVDHQFRLTLSVVFEDGRSSPTAWITGRRVEHPYPVLFGREVAAQEIPPAPVSSANPRVSIVIPVHNNSALTRACLETIFSPGNITVPFEVIVVDDGSVDDTPEMLREFGGRIHITRLSPNVGFAGACNVGAGMATSDFVVFLNNDTVPIAGWLDELVRAIDKHRDIAVVGARLLYPDGTVQHAGVSIGADGYPHHIYAGFPGDHPAVTQSRRMQLVTAACMLVRQADFRDAGGFDRSYLNGWEDADFCLRLGNAGRGIWYCAESVVIHHESATRDLRSERERRNRERWAQRWLGNVEPDFFRYWLADGLLVVDPIGPLYPQRIRFSRDLAIGAPLDGTGFSPPNPVRTVPSLPTASRGETSNPFPILGRVESPSSRPRPVGNDGLPVVGWALSHSGISGVETYVDGMRSGTIEYGQYRLDVIALHPEFIGSEYCGFAGSIPTIDLEDGEHILEIQITGNDGRVERISTSFTVDSTLHHASRIILHCDHPHPGSQHLSGAPIHMAGWALSSHGSLAIAAYLDGVLVRPISLGIPRPDVARSYPSYPDAERSGFAEIIMLAPLSPGEHVLTIQAVVDNVNSASIDVPFSIVEDE